MKITLKIMLIIVAIAGVLLFALYLLNMRKVEPTVPINIGGQRTITGTYICLPHKDTKGPQTLECAFGIKADDGFNYALSMNSDLIADFMSGESVIVSGLVVPLEAISSLNWYKYDIVGVMQVESADNY